MDELPETASLASAIAATKLSRSARLRVGSRLGSPQIETADLRGEGVVDFVHDRLWMTDRLVTERMSAGPQAAGVEPYRWVRGLVLILFGSIGGQESFFEGGAHWSKGRRRWRGCSGQIAGPKTTWNPLFLMDALASICEDLGADNEFQIGPPGCTLPVGRLSAELRHVLVASLSDSSPASALPRDPRVMLWIDGSQRIVKFSYENVFDATASEAGALWSTVEFFDFGTGTDFLGRMRGKLKECPGEAS